jgi:hypothetical protein
MALGSQMGLIGNPLLSRRDCRDDQHGWKSKVVTRSGVAVQVAVVGIEFGGILVGSLGSAVELEKKPEASLTSSVAPVPIRPATPTGTCGSPPPFQECVVTPQLCSARAASAKATNTPFAPTVCARCRSIPLRPRAWLPSMP